MVKRIALLSIMLLVFAGLGLAATVEGTVSDSMCGAKHAKASAGAASCVKGCIAKGGEYVLAASDGKVYKLDAQDKFKDFAGQSVKVTGDVSGDSITVQSVEAAGGSQ